MKNNKQLAIALGVILVFIGVSHLGHSLQLMDNSNGMMKRFGMINLVAYLFMIVAGILLVLRVKAGVLFSYTAFLISGLGLTQTNFYNYFSLIKGSFPDAFKMLQYQDFQWMFFSLALVLYTVFVHTNWIKDIQKETESGGEQ